MRESAENYLETIFVLGKGEKNVRAVDVANELGFSKPSVSVAMKNLREKGLAQIDGAGYITLTEDGAKIAKSMYERHTFISDWLISLGVGKEVALSDACKIEHVMSEESFHAIKEHIQNNHPFR